MIHADLIVATALSQSGSRYVWGAEASASDADPGSLDCSELVQWACQHTVFLVYGTLNPPDPNDALIAHMVDGSSNQIAWCEQHGTVISVGEAINTRGALLWHPGHIAMSLGDGRTIEAKGRAWGVGVFGAAGRFTKGARIPGANYGPVSSAPKPGQSKRRPKVVIVQAQREDGTFEDPHYAWNGAVFAHLDQTSEDLLVATGVAVRNGNVPFPVARKSLNRAHREGVFNEKTLPGDGK